MTPRVPRHRVRVPPIELALETTADPETAWRILTEPSRVVLWLTDASTVGPPGSAYRLDFGEGSVVTGVVVALEPGRRFVHTWAWEHSEVDAATTVEWTVEATEGSGSRIRLTHAGWDEAGEGPAARDDHEAYWAGYLDDLRDILEGA